MPLATLRLKKNEDRRIRFGHPWVYSNEVDTALTPLKSFSPGQEVLIEAHDKTLLGVAYVNPHSLIVARIFSRDMNDRLDMHFLESKLRNAFELRTKLFDKPYYRLVFSEADHLPGLVIDRFNDDVVVQINTAGMEQKQEILAESLCKILPNTRSILLRNDSQIREHEGLSLYTKALFGTPPDEILLEENGVKFKAPLEKGQKTGWFYDHRMNRARLQNYVKNRMVLDVFSYLGGLGHSSCKLWRKAGRLHRSLTICL